MKKKFMRFFSDTNKINIYLSVFCIGLVVTVLFSQLGLCISTMRDTLTVVDILEGKTSEYKDKKQGFVTLKLTSGTPSENILIFLNGNEIDCFNSSTKTIHLVENAVIEIYSKELIKINLSGYSDNIEPVLDNSNSDFSGMNVLCRVIFIE